MQFELSMLVGPVALGIVFVLALLVFAGLSVALVYHWREYGMGTKFVRFAPGIYFAVGGGLIALTIVAYLELL